MNTTIYVVCVDQERGKYLAYRGADRGWGSSEDAAIMDLLQRANEIKVEKVQAEL